LKNESRRADAEQENRKSKQGGKGQDRQNAPAPAYPTTQDQGQREASRKSQGRRGEPGLGANAVPASKGRSAGKNAGDKSGGRKKRQK